MEQVVFVDTSVLLQVLNVPGSSDPRTSARDREMLATLVEAQSTTLVLPATALIEAGNTIAKVSGAAQHHLVDKFIDIVRSTVEGTAPWASSEIGIHRGLLMSMLAGGTPSPA